MSESCKYEKIVDTQAKYGDICLTFGKNKGKSLKEIINEDKGPAYLQWLYQQMKVDDKPKSPTQRAIMIYIKSVYDL